MPPMLSSRCSCFIIWGLVQTSGRLTSPVGRFRLNSQFPSPSTSVYRSVIAGWVLISLGSALCGGIAAMGDSSSRECFRDLQHRCASAALAGLHNRLRDVPAVHAVHRAPLSLWCADPLLVCSYDTDIRDVAIGWHYSRILFGGYCCTCICRGKRL